jgi:hypothetical protein
MPRHQVQKHPDSPFVSLREKPCKVIVGPVTRGGLLIIPDIIARVLKGGVETGIQPEGVAAQIPDIIQLLDDPLKIPNTVSIGIVKRLGIYFVKNRIIEPLGHKPPPLIIIKIKVLSRLLSQN